VGGGRGEWCMFLSVAMQQANTLRELYVSACMEVRDYYQSKSFSELRVRKSWQYMYSIKTAWHADGKVQK
jgi:hypothetical protein